MLRMSLLATLAFSLCGAVAHAQMSHHQHASEAACEETALRCASKVTPAFAPDGTLWLAFMAGGHISVTSSRDQGRSFSPPVQATKEKYTLDWGPDARPQIVAEKNGGIALAFSTFRDKAFNGQVFATKSADGGQSFAEPKPITANNESQRFATLGLDADGTVFAAWIDKRNRVPAREEGRKYEGAGVFFASSKDHGASYTEAQIASDNTCECCRLGLAFAGPGRPVLVFRNIFEGGVRDHAVMTFKDPATPGDVRRVSTDDWQISACPHHGPSLSISPAGIYHVAWYTNGKARKGLFYARSDDEGRTFSNPLPLGRSDRNPTRPYVLTGARGATMVWKEFDGEKTSVNAMISHDEGKSWSKPSVIAETADTSDHPLLISDGQATYLSWMTKADGYRLLPIGDGS